MNTEVLKQSIKNVQAALNELVMTFDSNQPTQPEGYQGLNKWYRTSGGHIIFAVEINQFNCYGLRVKTELNRETHWCNDFALQLNIIDRLATEPEIIEAIKKGLEQKGIVKGVSVKDLKDNLITFISNSDRFIFDEESNTLHFNSVKVFDSGTFAEVLKNGKINCTCVNMAESMDCLKVCDRFEKVKDSSDKELLKECAEILKEANYHIPILSIKIKVNELVIKIKQTLKP